MTIAGSLAEASPATGLDGQPPPIRLEVIRSDGGSASFVGVLAADGRSWSVDGVDLGAADGTAVATVIAADAAGHVSRAQPQLAGRRHAAHRHPAARRRPLPGRRGRGQPAAGRRAGARSPAP